VLVHGGFVDGSGWEGVYQILKRNGHSVAVVQNPTTSLADDVAATRRVLAVQEGPVILVGHSYGGVVITEAGTDAKVAALVYIAAFAPDRGESSRYRIHFGTPTVRSCRHRMAILLDRAKSLPLLRGGSRRPEGRLSPTPGSIGVAALRARSRSRPWKSKPSWWRSRRMTG
jgi:pimeloyl-ACP methyl ester carboxylesterase